MTCSNCRRKIAPRASFRAFNEPYCEDCFYDNFIICQLCDKVVYRSESINDPSSKGAYCYECYPDEDEVDSSIIGKGE